MKRYCIVILALVKFVISPVIAQKTYTNMTNTITIEKYSRDTVLTGDWRKVYFKIKNPQNYQNVQFQQTGKPMIVPNNGEYHVNEVASTGLFDDKGFAKIMKEYQVKFTYRNIESHFSFVDTYYIQKRDVVFYPSYKTENALYQNVDNDIWISIPSLKGKYLVAMEDFDTDKHTFIKSDTLGENKLGFEHFSVKSNLKHGQLSVFTKDTFLLDKKEYYLIDHPKCNVLLTVNGVETTKTEFTLSELPSLEVIVTNQQSTKNYITVVNLKVERGNKLILERNEMMDGKLKLLKSDAKMFKQGDLIRLKVVNLQIWPKEEVGESEDVPLKGVYSIALDKDFVFKLK